MIKKITLTCSLAAGVIACKDSDKKADQLTQLHVDSLTTALTALHEPGYINGFAGGIVNEKGILYANGIGWANTESNTPYTTNTIQNIGSVSKTFIGISLLKAQELGLLDLDDPINQYLPFQVTNPNHPDAVITIRHLATHTSTILDTDFYDEKAYVLKDEPRDTAQLQNVNEKFNPAASKISMIAFLEKVLSPQGEWYQPDGFLEHKPGEVFEYSNVGATLAAAALEIATKKTFNEFATEHILKPLQMTSSGWSFQDVNLLSHSTLYADPQTALPHYTLITYPDGGLITNISDLSVYLSELIRGYTGTGTLLSSESYGELFKTQLLAQHFPDRDEEDDYDDEYNTGIFMGFTPKGYIGHTGGDPGIATYMFFNPATRTGRILMINTSITNMEGVEQFYAIWNKLGEYEARLSAYAEAL